MRVLLLLFLTAVAPAVEIEQYHSHDFTFGAASDGNPFDVNLEGVFTGPGGRTLRIPGFYDGEQRWTIRFAPPAVGAWSLRTASGLPALNGRVATALAIPNRHPRIHGSLRVDPEHPHHFVYEDGTRYFLLGYEADWLWGVDMLDPRRARMHSLVDLIAGSGFNHVLTNLYAHDTRWNKGRSCEWDYGPAAVYPWEGSNERPDRSRLNVMFFQIYDGMMRALQEKGIVAHLMIKVYNKDVRWPANHSPDADKYFRYVVARYQAFSNVVWDLSKETFKEPDNTVKTRLIGLIRSTDAYRRLLTAHDDDRFEWDPELSRELDFRTDQQHSDYAAMTLFDRARRAYPIVNAEFGYEYGVESLPTHSHVNQCDWKELLRRAYSIYMAGGYGVYYYNNTAWDVVKPLPEPPGMMRFQLLKDTLSSLPYWRMQPANHLAVGGPCLALDREVYACYAEGTAITLNLTGIDSAHVTGEWINTWDGATEVATNLRPAVMRIRKPENWGQTPGLLIVRAR